MKYEYYEIYEAPSNPTEYGTYYGKTPLLEQAISVCENAKSNGHILFIKGVTSDGTRNIFI